MSYDGPASDGHMDEATADPQRQLATRADAGHEDEQAMGTSVCRPPVSATRERLQPRGGVRFFLSFVVYVVGDLRMKSNLCGCELDFCFNCPFL
jgi:hypothetical protein